MEKENRRAREDARKEYNDTVRTLVMFIRKRDPRYKTHLKAQSQPPVTLLLPNLPARRAEVEPAAVYIEQEWQKTSVSGGEDFEWALAEGNDDPAVFECVPCEKTFKSEAAWDSHERSRKHIKNVEVLRRQMAEEGIQLGLLVNPGGESGPEFVEGSEQPGGPATSPVDDVSDKERETLNNAEKTPESQTQPAWVEESLPKGVDETERILPQEQQPSKRDKRRLREAKRQAQEAEEAHKCYVCEAKFESRSGLFNHLRGSGHTIARPTADTSAKKKGTRGKR